MGFLVALLVVLTMVFLFVMIRLMVTPAGDRKAREEKENFPIEDMLNARQRNNFHEDGSLPDEQMEEVAEKLLARIDRRINTLRDLIEKADQRIDTLQNPGYMLPAEFPGDDERNAGREDRRRRPAGAGQGREDSDPDTAAADRRTRIVSLHRRGVPTDRIARDVKMGKGEVELILKIEGYDT